MFVRPVISASLQSRTTIGPPVKLCFAMGASLGPMLVRFYMLTVAFLFFQACSFISVPVLHGDTV